MKNFIKILGIVLLIAGSSVSVFSAVPLVDGISIGVAALGLALLIGNTLKKVEKKTWKDYAAIALFAVSGFLLGFCGFTEGLFNQVATTVAGVVALVVALIFNTDKTEKKVNNTNKKV